MNLQETNFADILSFYYEGTYAREAAKELLGGIYGGKGIWLEQTLRYHGERRVWDPTEVAFRSGVDDLLGCYGILEIGATAGFVSIDSAPRGFRTDVLRLMENEHVRRYYAVNYPERLLQMFLLRLEGKNKHVEDAAAMPLYLSFLSLDRSFVQNHRNKNLLMLLDDFTIDGYRFDDLIALLERPDRFVRSLLKRRKSPLDCAVQELGLFLDFCLNLKELLEAAERTVMLQTEMWLRYAYWFEVIAEKLQRRLALALDRFVDWQPPEGGQRAVKEIQAFVLKMRRALETLFTTKYATYADTFLRRAGI